MLLGLTLVIAPSVHAQSVRGLFSSDVEDQGGRPRESSPRKDWRNTLDRQGRAADGGQQRRKMSEEERNILRQHLRDAASGAYPAEPVPRKSRR